MSCCIAITKTGKKCSRSYDTEQGDKLNRLCWQHSKSQTTVEKSISKTAVEKSISQTTVEKSISQTTVEKSISKPLTCVTKEPPLFRGLYIIGDSVYAKNSIGTAKDKRRTHTSWIAFYRYHTKTKDNICSVVNCNKYGTDGAHVEVFDDTNQYIIPMCRSHNVTSTKSYGRGSPTICIGSYILLKNDSILARITPYNNTIKN